MKNYQIKIFNKNNVFKRVISPSLIMSDISFTWQENGGQGQCTISLNLKIDNDWFIEWDIARITVFDDNNINWRLIYSWIITKIKFNIEGDGEYIQIVCIWLYSLLSDLFFNQSWYVFTKNQNPAQTIKDMIDYFNSVYTWWIFTYTWVANYTSSIDISFNYTNCMNVLQQIQKATSDFYFYVGADWNVVYRSLTDVSIPNNRLKFENEVDSMTIDRNYESTKNNVFVQYWSSVTSAISDATSITTFWQKDIKIQLQGLDDLTTANIYWNNYLEENKITKSITVLGINSRYDLELFEPWQTITLLNTTYTFNRLQIARLQYSREKVVLYVNKFESFAWSILQENE